MKKSYKFQKKPELTTKKLSKPKRNHSKVLLNSKLSINNLQLNLLGENHSYSLELSSFVYRFMFTTLRYYCGL